MKYWVGRTCKDCGNEDRVELTKEQVAFQLYDKSIERKVCSVFHSIQWQSIHHQIIKIDKALLAQWGADSNLAFLEQDEELILAEIEYLPIILEAIDAKGYLPGKITTLLEALCVLLYDNVANSEEYSQEENQKRQQVASEVIPELIKRKELIKGASPAIRDYIKEVVFPLMELNKNEI